MTRGKRFASIVTLSLLACAGTAPLAAAPMGTAFTYQGRFMDGGSPADGEYDFELKLYDAATSGTQQGSTVYVADEDVNDGYFTLAIDFGGSVFDGDARWLQIAVRPGASTGSYTTLSPRHELTPTPYALSITADPAFSSLTVNNSTITLVDPNKNVALGQYAGDGAGSNVSIGYYAGQNLDTGASSAFLGTYAGEGGYDAATVTGSWNVALGCAAMRYVTSGSNNSAVGTYALERCNAGSQNVAVGISAGRYNRTGTYNTWIGTWTGVGQENASNSRNTGVGAYTGLSITTGERNVFLGYGAGKRQTTNSDRLIVDNRDRGSAANEESNALLYGVFDSSSANQKLTINAKVGIATTSPSYPLHIDAGASNDAAMFESDGYGSLISLKDDYTTGCGYGVVRWGDFLDLRTQDEPRLNIDGSGNVSIGTRYPSAELDVNGDILCVSLTESSDDRLKTDVQPLSGVLDKLDQIRGVSFQWNEKAKSHGPMSDARQIGVLAQELEQVYPELVTTPKPLALDELLTQYPEEMLTAELRQRLAKDVERSQYKSVSYSKLTAVLLEAVKELRAENRALEQRIAALENPGQ